MIKVYSDVSQFRGSHYEFGYFQGTLLKNSPILPNRKKQWGPKASRHFLIDVKEFKAVMEAFAPKLLEEIRGLADALEMDWTDAVRDFGGYYLEYGQSGCSIFTAPKYLARNYDNEPLSYEGRFVLYQPDDGGYASMGPSMQITGRTDGLNEAGLSMGYNFINRRNSGNGFICNMIGRIVLETCADTDEAISLLKEIPHRHSFSYVLLDQMGKSRVVEASPRKVAVRDGNICTNHFEMLKEENRYRMDDSINRAEVMKSRQKNTLQPRDAFQMMNGTDQGVFSKKYGAWAGTLHTSMYFPQSLQAWFSLGGDQPPVIFNFEKWLKGEDTKIRRIKGKLDAKSVFVNMEKI